MEEERNSEIRQNPKVKSILYAAAFFFVITAAFITGLMMTPPVRRYGNATFNEVFDHLLKNHYSQPDAELLWQGAIRGMINGLDDPFTRYFDEADYSKYRQNFGESFVGIGINVENYNEKVLIRNVWPGSPAELGGLMSGDIITHIDGVDYSDASFNETTAVIIGEVGTEIVIGYQRAGIAETNYVTLIRALIENPSVEVVEIPIHGKKIFQLIIHTFGDETQIYVEEAVDLFENLGIDGLIIDLRDNGGGNLTTLVDILDLFLSKDSSDLPLFTLKVLQNGTWKDQAYHPETNVSRNYPITVLVNGHSASASEVFAAAMREYGGYTIIGETTYGKGTFQSSLQLQTIRGDRLNLTMGLWLTPEGHWVHFDGGTEGYTPDIMVEQNTILSVPMLYIPESEYYGYDQVSPRVQQMQTILNAIQNSDLRTDGYFDSNTAAALMAFQQEENLIVDGVLGAQTAVALNLVFRDYLQNKELDYQLTAAIEYLLDQLSS